MRINPTGIISLSAQFLLCFLLSGALRAEAAEIVRINGSGSALYAMKPLIRAYMKAHPGVRVEMEKPLGSSGAVKALLAGVLDVAVSSKPLKPEEVAKGAVVAEYGKTPLIIVSNKNVTKSAITTRELEDIYSGKQTVWSNGEPIRLVLRPNADIDTTILKGLSAGMERAVNVAHAHPGMIVVVTDPESDDAIEKTEGSLGAASLTSVLQEKRKMNVLALNGVAPSVRTLANGSYPLAKDIRFITTKATTAAAYKFIDFACSSQGRAIVEKAGVLVSGCGKAGR